MPAKKVSAKKGLSQPPLYAILLVTIVIVVIVLIFTLVPMGKKASEQEQQIMAKLDKTEEAGDVLLIISSVLLGITFLMMMKDFYMCNRTKNSQDQPMTPQSTTQSGQIQPNLPQNSTIQRQKVNVGADGSETISVLARVKSKLPPLSAFGCTPLLTIFTAAATLLISVIALTTQLSGKKTTESIISKNEKTYVDNNNEENTQIMAKNEENLKSFKRNILWSIILMILSFLLAITTAYVLSSFSRYKDNEGKYIFTKHVQAGGTKIGKLGDYLKKTGKKAYDKISSKCGVQVTDTITNNQQTRQQGDPQGDPQGNQPV